MTIHEDFKHTKISELILMLKNLLEEHGDLYVCHTSTAGYFDSVDTVSIANDSIIGGNVCHIE